jgi:glycosyltransferase involved in cell wall biosynthesis
VLEEEKPALLAQSQAFVMPSLSDTSSVALLEAMASGVPSVVSAFGGPAEIARRSSVGLVVDPRDADRLAGAIAQLLGNPPLARSFAIRGRDWVREHASAERMAREFVDCYRSVRPTPKSPS